MSTVGSDLALSYKDYDNEIGVVSFPVAVLTAANFAAQRTLHGDLIAAIPALAGGTLIREAYGNVVNTVANKPADAKFQREGGWLCRYRNADDGKIYGATIPCYDGDAAAVESEGSKAPTHVDILTALSPGAVFKAAFEAVVKITDTGGLHAVELLEVIHVGRRG